MKDLSIGIQKITGKPTATSECGVFTKRITLANSGVGTLVSCILARGEGKDLGDVVRGVFEIVEKKLEDFEGGILSALEKTVEPAKNYAGGVEVSLVHAFFYENVCYIARVGQAVKVFLFAPPNSGEISFESGSGPATAGQLYLIATENFFSIFDTAPLSQEAEVDLEEIIDGIATEIAGEENQSEVGAAFVAVKGEQVKQEVDIEGVQETEDAEVKEEAQKAPEETAIREEARAGEGTGEGVKSEDHPLKGQEPAPLGPPIQRTIETPKSILLPVFAQLAKIRRGDIGALRKNIVLVAIVVVLLLGGSVGFAVYKKAQGAKLAEFNQHIAAASDKYSEGAAILELNRSRAREILVEADREVKLALEIRGDDEKGRKLAEEIAGKLRETEVSSDVEFREVADLGDSLKSIGFLGKSLIAISGDKFYEVNLATGDVSSQSLGGGADFGVVFDKAAFVAAGEKIRRVDLADGKSTEVGVREGGLDMGVFAGNVYVLSTSSITKFVPIEAGYAQGTEYLSSPESFSGKSHMAIDGSIWVTSGGNIANFLRGEKQDFAISGLTGAGEFSLIYSAPTFDNLYVIDFVNSALLVIDKDGLYIKVLQSPEFSRASDLAVDEAQEKLYITSGSRVLEAAIK